MFNLKLSSALLCRVLNRNWAEAERERCTVAERAQRAANRKNSLQIKKTTFVNLTTHTVQMLTTQPKMKRAANKIYLVVLWALAVCFFICLCCEHVHHLLSKWWKCFLRVLFLFACVFWSCSALSSLGHRRDVCARAEQKLSRQTERKRERERCARAGKARPRVAVPAILGD